MSFPIARKKRKKKKTLKFFVLAIKYLFVSLKVNSLEALNLLVRRIGLLNLMVSYSFVFLN